MEDLQKMVGCFWIAVLIAGVVSLVMGGNWRTELKYVPARAERNVKEVEFQETVTAKHWLAGLVQGEQPDLQALLAKRVRPNEHVTELTLVTRHTFVDGLLLAVTLGIYSPVTVDVKVKVSVP